MENLNNMNGCPQVKMGKDWEGQKMRTIQYFLDKLHQPGQGRVKDLGIDCQKWAGLEPKREWRYKRRKMSPSQEYWGQSGAGAVFG